MSSDTPVTNLTHQVLAKINLGQHLIQLTSSDQNKHFEGIGKLQRKISQELKFLKKIQKSGNIKNEHLQCSNLTHFSALIEVLSTVQNCTNVIKTFIVENYSGHEQKITIDIICDGGLTWIKVIARNPKSLSKVYRGDASYGVRSIVDQAKDYLDCAGLHPCLFQTPKIIFVFANGVGAKLASKIESFGITVQGDRLTDFDYSDSESDSDSDTPDYCSSFTSQNISHVHKLNLDVSAMLAYVSSLTNGSAGLYEFSVQVLAQQAEWERQRPQKPILDELFKDKELYCCETARDNFIKIVETVGGPNERVRAEEFLRRITVLPDDYSTSDVDKESQDVFKNVQFSKDKVLNLGGKIKERSLVIFSFGDSIRAVTVTANDGFVRSAKQQGINFVVFVHESRPLTEQKEQTKSIGPRK